MRVRKSLAAAILLSLLVAAGRPGAGAESFSVPFRQFRLANGLRVVLSEDHSAPVVAVAVYYDVGSRNESRGRTGFAHLFEHMMFQGSENVGKAEHFKYVENNGGYFNGATHADYTNFYQMMPSNQLELGLWLESDRMRSLKITPENLRNQQEAVKEEKRLNYDNQAYWPALIRMDEMVFRNWANAHSSIGSMEDLNRARISDVKRFFDTYYSPNNAVLAVAGDFKTAEAEAMVRKYFGTIRRRPAPPPVDVSEPFEVAEPKASVEDAHAEMPALALAWKIPARRTADFYAVALLKSILADGESARLHQRLVKQAAIALEVSATLEERRGPSQVAIFSIHKQDAEADEVRRVIEEEIERLKRDGVTEEELVKVKRQYRLGRFLSGSEGGEYTSLQTALGRALALAEFTLFDGDPSLINTEIDRYLAVTPDQIRDAARRYFSEANRAVLYIRPAAGRPQPGAEEKRSAEASAI